MSACFLVFLLIPLAASFSPNFGEGECPTLEPVKPFNLTRYVRGLWFEASKFKTPFELGLRCNRAEYTLLPNGTLSVNNSGITATNKVELAIGFAYQEKEDENTGKIKVRFNEQSPYADYEVVKTDYDNFAVVHSCTQLNEKFMLQFLWILVRERDYITDENLKPLMTFLKENNIDIDQLELTPNSKCFDY